MIAYLRGKLRWIGPQGVWLETGGIGWFIRTPEGRAWPPLGSQVTVYTHLLIREDALDIYGFLSQGEARFFSLLRRVSGIGPRGALQILGKATPEELVAAILHEDLDFLTRLPGIGVKKARRILLELKEILSKVAEDEGMIPTAEAEGVVGQAQAALLSLGYSPGEIKPILLQAQRDLGDTAGVAELVHRALQIIGRGGPGA
ncbi:MAG TPA: Holliday junction branch migration protein RuvA [Moorella mulderi]|nr:Holliday junction branch migration protein RuvA [Moorella mulderi]